MFFNYYLKINNICGFGACIHGIGNLKNKGRHKREVSLPGSQQLNMTP